jgi:hypothetical protein
MDIKWRGLLPFFPFHCFLHRSQNYAKINFFFDYFEKSSPEYLHLIAYFCKSYFNDIFSDLVIHPADSRIFFFKSPNLEVIKSNASVRESLSWVLFFFSVSKSIPSLVHSV